MRPRLIIAGTAGWLAYRHRGYKIAIDGWEVYLLPSRTQKADLRSCWGDVLAVADASTHGGAHILAHHNVFRERDRFDAEVYGRHRLLWLEKIDFDHYGTESFAARVAELVGFEELWRESIRPRDPRSPLILPERSFNTAYGDMWRLAQRVRSTRGDVHEVVSVMERFREDHYSKGYWVDEGGKVFNPAAKHGIHVASARQWKFAYEVPPGFHFDVRRERGGEFSICDQEGVFRRFSTYTNVDCHGYIRGGD